MTAIRFGCGEFVPGGEPIIVPDLRPPGPPTLVPDLSSKIPEIPPFIPPSGPPDKFACLEISPGEGAPPAPAGEFYTNPPFRKCFPCDGALNKTGVGPGLNPSYNDPQCTFTSIAACKAVCTNPTARLPEPSGGGISQAGPARGPAVGGPAGGSTGRPGGPAAGGPTAAAPLVPEVTRPTTGGGARFYRCRQTVFMCPQDIGVQFNPRILTIQHNCVLCNTLDPNVGNGLSSVGPPKVVGSQALQTFESGCVYTSKAQCDNSCPPGPITANFVNDCFDPLSVATTNSVGGGRIPVVTINVSKSEPIAQVSISNNEPNSKIYHNVYNFFSQQQSTEPNTFGTNNSYPNIFKNVVAAQVANLINMEGSRASWNESMIFSLNLDQVEFSLDPELLAAFDTIHRPGGQLVGREFFLEMVRKHLLAGTLSEFDPEHYKSIAKRQLNDRRIRYTGTFNRETSDRAALGLIGQGAVVVDSSQLVNLEQRQIRRQRRLNTDVDAKVLLCVRNETETKDLFLTDAGIDVQTLENKNIAIPTGDGDGYYMAVERADKSDIPLVTVSDFSSTFYVPPETRYNALTLFEEDRAYILQASSVENQNEFVAGDAGPSSLTPLYLTLDLNSVSYGNNPNPLVSRYEGNYKVEKRQSVIDEHSKNNGLAVSRVNIDYRDPIYRYILDGGSVSLSLNDINLTTILNPKDYPDGVRIARNIPFGLIITPVAGSKYNPFNGQSQLASYGEPMVRTLRLSQDIDTFDSKVSKPELEEINLYNETGGDLRVGLAEPVDSQNIIYKYDDTKETYTNTFYRNGEYTTSGSTVSSTGLSYLVKDVLDYIVDTYNPGTISWYDVIRRMPINKVGEFLYDSNIDLISELERGYRRGLRISSVLNTPNNLEPRLLSDDDMTIIKEGER